MLLADRGFDDTYRAAHPDPLARLGTTWPAGRPRSATSWNPPPDAPHDRIDQVWVAGAATTVRSQIVGERGGRHVAIEVAPWGSDHRGVVSTVELTPGPSPVTVSFDPRLIRQGRDLTVTYHAPGGPGERVVIVPSGGRSGHRRDRPDAHPGRPGRRWFRDVRDGRLATGRLRRRAVRRLGRCAVPNRLPARAPGSHARGGHLTAALPRGGADHGLLVGRAREPLRLDRHQSAQRRPFRWWLSHLPLHTLCGRGFGDVRSGPRRSGGPCHRVATPRG